MGFKEKFLSDQLPLEAQEYWHPTIVTPETPIQVDQIILILIGLLVGLMVALVIFISELGLKRDVKKPRQGRFRRRAIMRRFKL